MVRSNFLACGLRCCLLGALLAGAVTHTSAQDDQTHIKVRVDLVQLNVAVTDKDGNYVTGLGPQDFSIAEDKIPEKIATFEAGNDTNRSHGDPFCQPTQATPPPIPRNTPAVNSTFGVALYRCQRFHSL